MAYEADIIKDSIASETGYRLTTMQVTLPRFVLDEFNTHRTLSRNSASSRAIPVEKQIAKVLEDPAIPVYWGKNQSGMQAEDKLQADSENTAKELWLQQRNFAVLGAVAMQGGLDSIKNDELKTRIEEIAKKYEYNFKELSEPVHKQITNRLLEPFMWQTIIVSATDWDNFFALRTHPDAQPEIQKAARLMKDAYANSEPELMREKDWHLPLIQPEEVEWAKRNIKEAIKVSVGRCARVSYLTHTGKREPERDIELHDKLISSGHMSPLEHQATPMAGSYTRANPRPYSGNFRGWIQYRKTIVNEDDYSKTTD